MKGRVGRRLRRGLARRLVLFISAFAARGGANRIRRIGRWIGAVHHALSWPFTGRLRRDIARALSISRGEAASALRTAYLESDRAVFEIISLARPECDVDELIGSVSVDDCEEIDRAAVEGKGMILLGMHMGNGILMAAHLARKGYPVTVVYRDPRRLPPGLLGTGLERAGLGTIALDRENPTRSFREMLRRISRGNMLYVLMDQANKAEGTPRRFLGKPLRMPIGVPRLATRTGAPVVPIHAESASPDWRFRVHPPLSADSPEALLDAIIDSMESAIRERPELWAWHHRRWKRYHFDTEPDPGNPSCP